MPEQTPSGPERLIDVEQLVNDLRERVERERAAGRYTDDVAALELEPLDAGPTSAVDVSGTPAPAIPQVVYRPEVGYSSRPVDRSGSHRRQASFLPPVSLPARRSGASDERRRPPASCARHAPNRRLRPRRSVLRR